MNRTIQNKFVVGIKHSNTYGILVLVILFITSNLYSQTVPYSSLYTNATFVKTINTNLAVGTLLDQMGQWA